MVLKEVIIKELNVEIIEIIKLVIKKMIKEIKWYLEYNDCYLKISFIRVKK